MITRLFTSSASTRATSRSIVVLPTPGRPRKRTLSPVLTMSSIAGDRAEDGAADAAGEADDPAAAVADARDAVQRALDAGAVVFAELADARDDVLDVALGDLALAEHDLPAGEAGLRQAAEVHDDLQQLVLVGAVAQRVADVRRQGVEQQVQVVGDGRTQAFTLPRHSLRWPVEGAA